jgi:hypothetical protein
MKVFILGSPRSGTSITYLSMRRVFGLPGRGESHVMPIFLKMLNQLDEYKKNIPNPNILLNELNSDEVRVMFVNFLRTFYGDAYSNGSFVDKTPGTDSIYCAPLIKQCFPDAKIIVTKRSGVEVVSSSVRKFSAPVAQSAKRWVNCMHAIEWATDQMPEMLVIDQYDIANATSEVAARISSHLGAVEAAPDLVKFFKGTTIEKRSDHDYSHRLKLSETRWSEQDKAVFREIAGETMERFGYDF